MAACPPAPVVVCRPGQAEVSPLALVAACPLGQVVVCRQGQAEVSPLVREEACPRGQVAGFLPGQVVECRRDQGVAYRLGQAVVSRLDPRILTGATFRLGRSLFVSFAVAVALRRLTGLPGPTE